MKTRARGFTLIEMMISMALFGLIAAGAMALVMAGARSQAHSSRVDTAQASLRAGIDFITRDAMMASAGASTGIIIKPNGTQVNAVDFATTNNNQNNNGTTNTDKLDMYLVDGTISSEMTSAVLPGLTSLPVTYELTAISGQFPTTGFPYPVQVSDLKTGCITNVSAVTNATLTGTLTVAALPAGCTFASGLAYVLPSRHVIYEINNTVVSSAANTNNSMLTMSVNNAAAQPLAEGIEDMQVAYGFDTDADNIVTEHASGNSADDDEWLYNAPGDTIKASMTIANLRVIRVTLIAKSTSIENGALFNGIAAYEDHAAVAADGFIRRVLRSEIAVRNFNLQ
jgi:type IV pilus assembly protein PilW